MKMYHWRSRALKNWMSGDIFVLAKTEADARKKAFKYGLQYFDKDSCFYSEDVDKLIEDISVSPTSPEVYFVAGSA